MTTKGVPRKDLTKKGKCELERMAAPSTPTKTGGFSPEFARHRLVSNTYAVKVQEAGSSIPFALTSTR